MRYQSPMARLDLRMQTLSPAEPWWPDDEVLGGRLASLVKENLPRNGAPTVGLVVRRDKVVLVPLRPVVQAKWRVAWLLGGLARWDEGDGAPEAIGLMGQIKVRKSGDDAWSPLAVVFLEWPDGRWWHWRGVLDGESGLLEGSEDQSRAVDGLARPSGLGGWWTLARRHQPDLKLERVLPPVASNLVQ
jgi:hypothetical protein